MTICNLGTTTERKRNTYFGKDDVDTSESPGAGVIGNFEPPDMDVGNWAQDICKSSMRSYLPTHPLYSRVEKIFLKDHLSHYVSSGS